MRTKGGNDLRALFDFELKCSHLSVKGNFSSLPSHFCLLLFIVKLEFCVYGHTVIFYFMSGSNGNMFSLKKFEMLKMFLGRSLSITNDGGS